MLGIAAIAGIKALLTKGFSLGVILLLFFVKGKKLKINSDQWDDFFLKLSAQKIQRYAIGIYLIATCISTIISYFLFSQIGYSHSLEISVLLFAGGLIATSYKWKTKGKDYLTKRYQEIPKMILEKREKENINK